MRRHALPIALMLLLVAAALWPLPLFTEALGHPYGDMADHYWGSWWVGRSLLDGRLPIVTDVSHYPMELRLWYVDPVGSLLALISRPLGFPAAFNLMVYAQIGLAALAGYALGFDISQRRSGGVTAGVVLAASPFVLGLVHSGLTEYLGLAPVALFVLALVRAMGLDPRGRPVPRFAWLWAGLLLGLSATQAWYYGLFGAMLACCLVLGPGWRGRLRPLLLVGVVSLVSSLPAAAAILLSFSGEGAVSTLNAPGWRGNLPATDLLTWVRPGPYYYPDTPRLGNPGVLHVNYLGWAALSLGALGWSRARGLRLRPLAPGLVVFAILCLGPRLALFQHWIELGAYSIRLPMGWLYLPFSPVALVHQPYRMVAFLLPFLALSAALGTAALPRWARWLPPLAVLAEVISWSPAPWPLATRPVRPPPLYAQLEAGPILDWPPDGSTWNRDYLVWQVSHGQPVAYGVNVALHPRLRSQPLVQELLRELEDLDRLDNRDLPFREPLFPPGPRESLGQMGFRHVILHRQALTAPEYEEAWRTLSRALGPPVAEDEEGAVFRVVP